MNFSSDAGKKPMHDLIERLHLERTARQAVIAHKVNEIHERMGTHPLDGESVDSQQRACARPVATPDPHARNR